MKKLIVAVLIICIFSFAYAATYRKIFKITNSDQSTFNSSDSAGAAVRMYNYGTDPTGGSKTLSGSLTEIGSGLWYYDFDPDSSGYYLLQSYTTATAAWADISGYAPIYITNESPLYLDGGTMSGNIAMGDNDITGIDALAFTDTDGEIAGIPNKNIPSKAEKETIAGAWDFDGACTVTAGSFDFTEDKCLINSIIVSPHIYITYSEGAAENIKAATTSRTLFICDAAFEVVGVDVVFETAESGGADMYLQIERLTGVEAKGDGDDILTNEGGNGISLKGAAKTVINGDIHATNKIFASGERVGLVITRDGTTAAGLVITIKLKRVR